MKKGDIWWADLPSPIGRRPFALLSRNEAYSVRNAVTVAEITSLLLEVFPSRFLWGYKIDYAKSVLSI